MLLSGKLEEISNSSHLENSLSIPFKFSREDYLEKKKMLTCDLNLGSYKTSQNAMAAAPTPAPQ